MKCSQYLIACAVCGGTTSKKYSRAHDGQCKRCAEPTANVPTRNERIIEHGYDAYAREEGHYDLPDWA